MTITKPVNFYDTRTGKKRPFESLEPGRVSIYSCGPTVYNYAHIGNFRNFVFIDVLRRTLKLFGFSVQHVRNLTDVDDKIIRLANEKRISFKDVAMKYEKEFFKDCAYLRLQDVEHNPRATDHIDEMKTLVKRLIDKGYTYERDGSVYFSVDKFNDYGKLSGIDLSAVRPGTRIDTDEYSKEDARDFVLWKGRREGEPYWDADFGPGRPGWHLECSAMSRHYLGNTFDIHTGAEDLIFPHHENEIAQSEAANGQEYVRYWLHCAFLNMKDQKMSKSLGNIITAKKLRDEGVNGLAVRYFLLSVHYRKPLSFSYESIDSAQTAVSRLQTFYSRIQELANNSSADDKTEFTDRLDRYTNEWFDALGDDLNTAKALGSLFELVRETNGLMDRNLLGQNQAREIQHFLSDADSILDVMKPDIALDINDEIETLVDRRNEARKARDFQEADRIRDQLKKMGIIVEDTREGIRWRRV
jgi:cysteinyl-tRNA synthetase